MSEPLFVGFDTSNYTTSAAVCDADGEVLLNARTLLPVREGERGLRQSDAVFFHVRNLPDLLGQVRETVRGRVVRAVGCSVSPRRAEGSYMPCFLSGIMAAEAFAAAIDVPVLRFAHQEGHIMAALHSAGGVMSNRYLQSVLAKRAESYFAAPEFSADNAAGVALLTRRSEIGGTGAWQ